ncbi:MAG: type II secretion system protein [Phycisphaerae bacterium]|nr:type II secretion system protein [Phycisphaerae bacterium]
MTRTRHKRRGFSLIELLVVIGIISLLVGLLSPGIRSLTKAARTLKQKSVLHGYATGLELFRKDFEDYPPSELETDAFGTGQTVGGAQHLAEALMGRDIAGFDPTSRWCDDSENPDVYGPASMNRRKDPYVVVKDDGVYSLAEVYDVSGGGNIGNIFSPAVVSGNRAPVMTDIFGRKKVTLVNGERVKAGAPVLYFRADTTTKRFMGAEPIANHRQWIYNYRDNRDIIELGTVMDQTVRHKFDTRETTTVDGTAMDGLAYFYEKLRHPQFRTRDAGGAILSDKPYNPNTFILISAGWDGIFGTKDDVTNYNY